VENEYTGRSPEEYNQLTSWVKRNVENDFTTGKIVMLFLLRKICVNLERLTLAIFGSESDREPKSWPPLKLPFARLFSRPFKTNGFIGLKSQ
jgi:hypothetical protein